MNSTPDRRRNRSRRLVGIAVLAAVGGLLLLVPAYDVWEDIYRQGEIPLSTLIENVLPALLAAVPLVGAARLYRSDWHTEHVRTVAQWCLGVVAAAAAVMGCVLGIQLLVQGGLKPVIIAADTVVAAGAAGVMIGVYSARSEGRAVEAERERDRLGALLDNTTDAIATVRIEDGVAVIQGANPAFADTFGIDPDDASGRPLRVVLDLDSAAREGDGEFVERALGDEPFETEVTHDTADGERHFLRRVIPFQERRAYVAYTDVTDQRELQREVTARNRMEYLHGVASEMTGAQERSAVCALALDAVGTTFDASEACLTLDGDAVATEGVEGPLRPELTGADRPGGEHSRVVESGERFERTLVVPVGDRGTIQIGTDDAGAFDERNVEAVELLAANVSETLARLEREETVREERERLEFLNRALRHNLLNGMNVVDGRAQILQGHVEDGFEDHLEIIDDRTSEMISVVETMRSFMEILTEEGDHEPEPVALKPVLEREAEKIRNAHDADIALGPVPEVDVYADELLDVVFENLFTNAVQHNDKSTPEVRVRAEADEERVTVTVADNGPGVPDEEKADIFEKGVKGLRSPGSGFGLYLVNQILDFYGGSTSVGDNDPEGAVFEVRLRRA